MKFIPPLLHAFSISFLYAAEPPEPPVSSEDALATIHVRDGYVVELVASEPLVMDPVAISWGADGKLWVTEMADYPLGMDESGTPGGRVRFLEDLDGDGKMDRSTLFAENLNFPSGVLPWRDGALVTAAPEILFLRDADGDGKSDSREVLFRGFAEDNQQLRVNGLRRGLDSWIYCASGSPRAGRSDSKVESLRTGEVHALGSLDFRFRPDTGEFEIQSGPTQFGRNRDEWGNWFGCMNSHPLWHYVLDDTWLKRNPFLNPPDPRRQLVLPRNPRVYPAKEPQKRFHSFVHNGRYTSSCSGMIYRDDLLFPDGENRMHAFSCEPFHNLVQHIVVEEDGVSFKAERPESDGPIDFFASTDRWCRPVMARTGPDGALYIVDIYRYIIEHSQFLPETGKKELAPFIRAGDDRGRIYRVFPKGGQLRKVPGIHSGKPEELVQMLESPNGVVRDLVQEQILQAGSQKEETLATLEQKLTRGGTAEARLHSLHILENSGKRSDEIIGSALSDSHPEVRRNAARIAADYDTLPEGLLGAVEDPNQRVRMQVAASLGQWPDDPQAANALAALAIRDAGDPHFDAVVLSSATAENIGILVDATLEDHRKRAESGNLAGRLLAMSLSFGEEETARAGLRMVLDSEPSPGRFSMISGLLDSLSERDSSIEKLIGDDDGMNRRMDIHLDRAMSISMNAKAAVPGRAAAIRMLARSEDGENLETDLEFLKNLLKPSVPSKLQSAVIAHLGTLSSPLVAEVLLSGWKSHGPDIRAEVLGVIPTRKPWAAALLNKLEANEISPGQIGPTVQLSLRRGTDADGRERLASLFSDEGTGTEGRKEIIEQWKPALALEGVSKRGKEVFQRACATCHELDGIGNDVGPDLASLSDRRPIALFTAILDPNAQMDARYTNYVATTKDEKIVVGFLAAETSNSITLKSADGLTHDILRENLNSLDSTGLSLMPEGLEAAMDPQNLADLIAYLSKAGLPGGAR